MLNQLAPGIPGFIERSHDHAFFLEAGERVFSDDEPEVQSFTLVEQSLQDSDVFGVEAMSVLADDAPPHPCENPTVGNTDIRTYGHRKVWISGEMPQCRASGCGLKNPIGSAGGFRAGGFCH